MKKGIPILASLLVIGAIVAIYFTGTIGQVEAEPPRYLCSDPDTGASVEVPYEAACILESRGWSCTHPAWTCPDRGPP
jgi:hypothetical protein